MVGGCPTPRVGKEAFLYFLGSLLFVGEMREINGVVCGVLRAFKNLVQRFCSRSGRPVLFSGAASARPETVEGCGGDLWLVYFM